MTQTFSNRNSIAPTGYFSDATDSTLTYHFYFDGTQITDMWTECYPSPKKPAGKQKRTTKLLKKLGR